MKYGLNNSINQILANTFPDKIDFFCSTTYYLKKSLY